MAGADPADIVQEAANPKGWHGQCYARRKDGTDLTALLSINPIVDEHTNLLGLIGIAQDVTECKRAERELVFKSALLQAAAETTLDGICPELRPQSSLGPT